MQNTTLSFYQRVVLQNLCGNYQVSNLTEASVYLRLIEKIRLSDEEITKTEFVIENGNVSWSLPRPTYGEKSINLENTEAEALAKAINKIENIKVNDAVWLVKIVESLGKTHVNAISE